MFGTITYWLGGLNASAECFGLFLLILILLSFSSQALGLLVSAAAPNQAAAGAIGPFVTIVVLLFAGFYLNADSIPLGAQWLQYFSHLRYAFLRFCIVEFSGEYGDTAFVCDTACADLKSWRAVATSGGIGAPPVASFVSPKQICVVRAVTASTSDAV